MKKKKTVRRANKTLDVLLVVLFGAALFLIFYLTQAVDKLIRIQEVNAAAVKFTDLPSQQISAASCGT